ncbi:unnamed protein product [Calypogeia fissa]
MAKQGSSFNLGLEMAPPRIIATHRRKSSEIRLDTILEENDMSTFSESGSPSSVSGGTFSPSVKHQRFGAELSRLAGFPVYDGKR